MSKKIIILSQPKAGTYLCANLLQELGFGFDGYHLARKKYHKYPPPTDPLFKMALKDPKHVEYKIRLKESIKSIAEGSFAVSHLIYNPTTESLLQGFHKICITRPENEIFDSLKRWEKATGRPPANMIPTVARIHGVAKWIGRANVFHITYNDMKNCNVDKIDQLQQFLGLTNPMHSKQLCDRALKRDSKTKIT